MTGLVWRAKRLGVGCSSAELAAYLGYLHGLDVSPSDVRAWESDDVDPPEVLGEVLAELAERRDTQARSWVVAHETIRIPADRQHLPTGWWWAAAARALEVCDVDVVEETPAPETTRTKAPRSRLLDAMDIEQAQQYRAAGMSWRAIAAEFDVSEHTVRKALGPDRRRSGPKNVVSLEAVLRLREQGLSHEGIARQLHCSKQAVTNRLAEVGLASWGRKPPKWTKINK